MRKRLFILTVVAAACLARPAPTRADVVPVRYAEGLVHGFLALRTASGDTVANGDLIQHARGNQVTTRLVYRFKDGSIQDETAVFSQRGHFRLITDHLVQKGPAFQHPLDMKIDVASGTVTVQYSAHGQSKTETEHMELPADLANGLIITLLKNVRPSALPPTLSYMAATPKPRLVKLELSVGGSDPFRLAGSSRRATHYVLKVKIGGLTGVLADWFDKIPPDSHVWVLQGDAPAFVRSESPLQSSGPLMRTELVSPTFK